MDDKIPPPESVAQPDPWEQMEGESNEHYEWFAKFYLALGLRRSLRSAFRLYLMEREPTVLISRVVQSAPQAWSVIAQLYKWESRALAFDKIVLADALKSVEEAAVQLRLAAPEAVKTLIRELASSRNGVMAAKEILDRAGVQTAAIQKTVEFSADDYAKAEEELAAWNQTDKSLNG